MQLYGSYTSPYVRHCRLVLLELDLECTFIETDHAASAAASPTKRVPFLHDGAIALTDSAAIIRHLRSKVGQPFLQDAVEYDRFCMVNTALDTTVNLFMLEKDGVTPAKSPYLKRQSERVHSTLAELNRQAFPPHPPYNDAELRLACYLAWGLYRRRIELAPYQNLSQFLENTQSYDPFRVTAPPKQ